MAMIKAIKKADDAMAASNHFFHIGSFFIKKMIVAIIVSGTRDTLNIVSHIRPTVIHTFQSVPMPTIILCAMRDILL